MLVYSPLDCKEIQPVHPKGSWSWIFLGRTDVEAEAQILWPPWCEGLTHLKRPWCWERLRAGGEGDDRGWDDWMASPTQWTWVWVNSRELVMNREAWLGRRVGHDWATELNWTAALQAALSLEFPRQEYWSSLPFLLQEIFPTERSVPGLPFKADFLPSESPGKPWLYIIHSGTLSCSNYLNSPLASPSMIQSFGVPNQEAVIWYAEASSRWQRDTRHLAHPFSLLVFNSYFPRLDLSPFRFHRWAGRAWSSSTGGAPLGPALAPPITGNEATEVVKSFPREAGAPGRWLTGGMADEEEDPTVSDRFCSNPLFYLLPRAQQRKHSGELGFFTSVLQPRESGTSPRASLFLLIHPF